MSVNFGRKQFPAAPAAPAKSPDSAPAPQVATQRPGSSGPRPALDTADALKAPAATAAVATASTRYTVVAGDTTSGIAARYGSTVDAIAKANALKNAGMINVGQKLVIPGRAFAVVSAQATLAQVAAQFGTSAANLAAVNKLDPKAPLKPGKQLLLSGATVYSAKSGDTLAALAKRFNTTAQAIAGANGLDPAKPLAAGQTLVFFAGHAPAPTPGPTPVPPPSDPKLMQKDQGNYKYVFDKAGKLFIDGASIDDVEQGQAGDCYFLSSIAALAKTHPEVIQKAIQQNKDGTYTVTFQEASWVEDKAKGTWSESFKPVQVKIDGDLPGSPGYDLYAQEGRSGHELWPALLEKAFAKWKGGYEQIGNGGWPADALSALTGKPGKTVQLAKADPVKTFARISKELAAGYTLCACSKAHSVEIMKNGVVSNHAYSVIGVSTQNGQQYVQLRNPWGYQEFGNDGNPDGTFLMPVANFIQDFAQYDYVS